jgi:hypothetical protein
LDPDQIRVIDLNISPSIGELESIDWKVIPVDSSIQEAPEFAAIYKKYADLLAQLDKTIGSTTVALDARSGKPNEERSALDASIQK